MTRSADGAAALILNDGSALLSARGGAKEIRFAKMSTTLPAGERLELRTEAEALMSLSLDDLALRARGQGGGSAEVTQRASIELHRRFSLPLATLVFGFLAVPLFVSRKNFSRASGGMMGVLSTVAYYGLVQLGDGLIQGGTIPPNAGVWFPNVLLTALALLLLVRALGAGSLGHAFDRPQRSATANAKAMEVRERPHRFALPRYVGNRFIALTLLSFAVIFSAYLLIDVMERLEWFARYRASGAEILHFYSARVPLLASRAIPMAILVGSSLIVSLLAVEGGKLIRMRRAETWDTTALPFQAPATSLNRPITPRRSFAYCSISLEQVKRVKQVFGVTVNDVVVAICGGALRAHLASRDELPEASLVAAIPVSARSEDQTESFGNAVSGMFTTLATNVKDPVERLHAVNRGTRSAKDLYAAGVEDAVMEWAGVPRPAAFSLLVRLLSWLDLSKRLPPVFNILMSNVPGPPVPLYAAGAQLLACHPMGPLIDRIALNVTVLSCCGEVGFGFLTCPDVVEDPWAISDRIPEALEELVRAARRAELESDEVSESPNPLT